MSETIKTKLQEWEIRLGTAQTGHYIVCERYRRLHNVIGLSLVCLSTFVGAFIFFPETDSYVSTGLKVAGVLVAILAAIQTFIRPLDMCELHRIKAIKYGVLKRQVEVFTCMPDFESKFPQFSTELMTGWNAVSEDSPITPNSVRKKTKDIINNEIYKTANKG